MGKITGEEGMGTGAGKTRSSSLLPFASRRDSPSRLPKTTTPVLRRDSTFDTSAGRLSSVATASRNFLSAFSAQTQCPSLRTGRTHELLQTRSIPDPPNRVTHLSLQYTRMFEFRAALLTQAHAFLLPPFISPSFVVHCFMVTWRLQNERI